MNIIYFYEPLTDAFSDLFRPQKIDHNQNIQLNHRLTWSQILRPTGHKKSNLINYTMIKIPKFSKKKKIIFGPFTISK
ncbi:hypothetical protein BpHYR1_047426 [Brachionus plicatilis]|uniref:Uncharacterized protein n=1 Tax=Brachionus plicatilis TaxID=10195 RepID=A0A3M7T213_BRAPC|nr:hypothetical protein BpHYR1_047426 [Brachionus plicatilis]